MKRFTVYTFYIVHIYRHVRLQANTHTHTYSSLCICCYVNFLDCVCARVCVSRIIFLSHLLLVSFLPNFFPTLFYFIYFFLLLPLLSFLLWDKVLPIRFNVFHLILGPRCASEWAWVCVFMFAPHTIANRSVYAMLYDVRYCSQESICLHSIESIILFILFIWYIFHCSFRRFAIASFRFAEYVGGNRENMVKETKCIHSTLWVCVWCVTSVFVYLPEIHTDLCVKWLKYWWKRNCRSSENAR